MDGVARRVTERIKNNRQEHSFKEYFFFSKLMLTKPYPVNFWYYPSVLHFLFYANKNGLTSVHFGFKTIQDLLQEWLDVCLFHLSNKKGLRYLWACERLSAKITKQSFIMLPSLRGSVKKMLDKELFYIPEEQLAPLGPNEASVVIDAVETSLAFFRSKFIGRYFDNDGYSFKENLAKQEYLSLSELSKTMDKQFAQKYEFAKKELGGNWEDLQSYENLFFDQMGSAICDILLWNEDQLHLLTQAQKQRLKLMAELNCTNFADEVCEKLGIKYNMAKEGEYNMKGVENFFDPSVSQFITS